MTTQLTPPPVALPSTGHIRQSRLLREFVPISAPTLWRWVKAGKFPKPEKLGERAIGWRCEDVRDWIQTRGAASA